MLFSISTIVIASYAVIAIVGHGFMLRAAVKPSDVPLDDPPRAELEPVQLRQRARVEEFAGLDGAVRHDLRRVIVGGDGNRLGKVGHDVVRLQPFGFGLIDLIALVGFVHQHAHAVVQDFDDPAVGGEMLQGMVRITVLASDGDDTRHQYAHQRLVPRHDRDDAAGRR